MPDKVKFRGFQSPNYTQVPDELFDEVLATVSGAELKVLLYIVRRTFGFKKASDNISLSQITDGIVTNGGKRIDSGTGLVKSTAALAVKGLVEKNIILKIRNQTPGHGDMATTYALNLLTVPVQKSTPPVSENQTPPGQKIGHPGGGKSDTQETVTKKQLDKIVNDVTANDQKSSPKGDRTTKGAAVISDQALRSTYGLSDHQIGRIHWLVEKQGEILGAMDRNHASYVKRAAEAERDGLGDALDYKLGDFKQAAGEITVGTRPGYFHRMWVEELKHRRAHPPDSQSAAPSDSTPHRIGTLFGQSTETHSAQTDPRIARLIADAEGRGFPIPPHIRTADIQAVNRWWATLPEAPIRRR